MTKTDQIRVPILRQSKVDDILSYLKQCYPDLPLSEDTILVTVNNRVSSADHVLEAGDRIALMPYIGGG
jgi:sulfur carrier protein ThiS